MPITLVVLTVLFVVQRHGTGSVGKLLRADHARVVRRAGGARPAAHRATTRRCCGRCSPHYALAFLLAHPGVAFVALGAVVLCVTGGEALYADMGHFGKRPIRIAWFGLVMPALVLNYFGQGALLLAQPEQGRATRST